MTASTPGGGEPRRYLITGVNAEYLHEPAWNRRGLNESRQDIVNLFTGQFGYEHVGHPGPNPTQENLRNLRDFFTSPARRPDDLIVLYLACHGEVLDEEQGGGHVLLTADTKPYDVPGALRTEELAGRLLAGSAVRRLLLLLDTCFSGQGANELAARALERMNPRIGQEPGSGLVVISSALPMEQAETGAFPRRLEAAVENLIAASSTSRTLAPDALVHQMNIEPGCHRVGLIQLGLTGEVPAFLPNPGHQAQNEVDLDTQRKVRRQQQASRREEELRTRLMPRAMGASSQAPASPATGGPDTEHWWFSGRRTALAAIAGWLAVPAGEVGARESTPTGPREASEGPPPSRGAALAVTARPGSGKTAVLGLFATLAHPQWRHHVPLALDPGGALMAAAGQIDAAIYAQGLTDHQVMAGLAAAAACEADTAGTLLDALGQRQRPLTVLIDALDEAASPGSLCDTVLHPLLKNAKGRIRLLLGTRPHLLSRLNLNNAATLDLDGRRYTDPEAVLTYTMRILKQGAPESPYLSCPPPLQQAVAGAIAEAAGHSFLVARITAGSHAAAPELPDPDDPAWRVGLPRQAGQAMARDLADRLGSDAPRAADLLRPLAYAQGQGMPLGDLWAPIASAVSGRQYTAADIHWLREEASFYLVEAMEEGRAAYRLHHQALAEHLRAGYDARTVHAAIARTLRERVSYGSQGERQWQHAHPYTLQYLAVHAAEGGELDAALTEPEYLAHAAPEVLLPYLDRATCEPARLAAAAYRSSIGVHRDLSPAERRPLLALDALRYGGSGQELAAALQDGMESGVWQPVWATGSGLPAALRNTLSKHDGEVRQLAFCRVNEREVLVSTSADGTARVWEPTTGQQLGVHVTYPHTGLSGMPGEDPEYDFGYDAYDGYDAYEGYEEDPEDAEARTAPTCVVSGDSLLLAVAEDGTIELWDLTTDGYVSRHEHGAQVTAMAATVRHGRQVLVIGDKDGNLSVRATDDGQLVGQVQVSPRSAVHSLSCVTAGERPIAVTLCRDGTYRAWDLDDCKALGPPYDPDAVLIGPGSPVCTVTDGHPVVITGGDFGDLEAWNLVCGEPTGTVFDGPSGAFDTGAFTTLAGRPILVTGGADMLLRVWDLATGSLLRAVPTGHEKWITAVACTVIDGRPVAVSGDLGGSIRITELSAAAPVGAPAPGHPSPVMTLSCTRAGDRPLAITAGSDGTVLTWDLSAAQPTGQPLSGHRNAVSTINCTTLEGRSLAVTGDLDGTALVWDLATRSQLGPPMTGHSPRLTLGTCTILARQQVTHTLASDGTIRIRNLQTEQLDVRPPTAAGLLNGAAAYTTLDRRRVVVTGGWELTVRDLYGTTVGRPGRVNDLVIALTCLPLADRTLAFTASREGLMEVWELGCNEITGGFVHPTSDVRALACTVIDGCPITASAGELGPVFIWDLNALTLLATIHLPAPCRALTFTETGDLLAAYNSDLALLRRRT
ncbi:hypothetical protein ACFVU0_34525 [Streptomyces sp. NPDC058122]|uniref:hypothetical protein n=1 Tax=Streptomyces sp. NPDC058122 TaxID=3346349 RepID=UPI0036E1FEBF